MLAMSDKHGEIHASVPGLARRAGVPREACETALHTFLSPDPDSRSRDYQGRRIEEIDGGWSLLNHPKYRDKMSKEDRKLKTAARVRRHRARKAQERAVTGNVTKSNAGNDIQIQTHIQIQEEDARDDFDSTRSTPDIAHMVRHELDKWFISTTGMPPSKPAPSFGRHVIALAEWLSHAEDPEKTFRDALAGFKTNAKAEAARYPVAFLANNPAQYLVSKAAPHPAADDSPAYVREQRYQDRMEADRKAAAAAKGQA